MVAAIKTADLKDVAIIGVDGSDEAAEQIKSSNMVGTALQQAALIAETGAEQAGRYLKTGGIGKDEKQFADCIAIIKDSVDKLRDFVRSG